MREYHIWDLERVSVQISAGFNSFIIENIKQSYGSRSKAYKYLGFDQTISLSTFKSFLSLSRQRNHFVPLEFYTSLLKIFNISFAKFESSIIGYKTSNGTNQILEPKLPIQITPVFAMIWAHHVADGTVISTGKRRLPYFGYRQLNDFYRENYLEKLEFVFGNIYHGTRYSDTTTRVYCPSVLSTLFFKYSGSNERSFRSESARIPLHIFEGKDNYLAILIAFIIDEGHVDSTLIVINLKNKGLIEDLEKICSALSYAVTVSENKRYLGYYCLYILRSGMKKLYEDYLLLQAKYSCVHLGWKEEKIKQSFAIISRPIQRVRGNQQKIISFLEQEDLSVNQLAEKLSMTRQGVRNHINNLINDDKVRLVAVIGKSNIYGVHNAIRFSG